jgi:hypothetical protein
MYLQNTISLFGLLNETLLGFLVSKSLKTDNSNQILIIINKLFCYCLGNWEGTSQN